MRPGASHLTRKSMAQTAIKVCSLLIQTAQSVRSLLAVAGSVVVETQLQCAVMLHPSVDISVASFPKTPFSHLILMMQATYSSSAMSMAATHDEHCSFIRLLPGKLSK